MGVKYLNPQFGERLYELCHKATSRHLDRPDEVLNQQVVDMINSDTHVKGAARDAVTCLKRRLQMDHPQKQYLAIILTGKVLQKCDATIGAYQGELLQEVTNIQRTTQHTNSDAAACTRQAAKDLLARFGSPSDVEPNVPVPVPVQRNQVTAAAAERESKLDELNQVQSQLMHELVQSKLKAAAAGSPDDAAGSPDATKKSRFKEGSFVLQACYLAAVWALLHAGVVDGLVHRILPSIRPVIKALDVLQVIRTSLHYMLSLEFLYHFTNPKAAPEMLNYVTNMDDGRVGALMSGFGLSPGFMWLLLLAARLLVLCVYIASFAYTVYMAKPALKQVASSVARITSAIARRLHLLWLHPLVQYIAHGPGGVTYTFSWILVAVGNLIAPEHPLAGVLVSCLGHMMATAKTLANDRHVMEVAAAALKTPANKRHKYRAVWLVQLLLVLFDNKPAWKRLDQLHGLSSVPHPSTVLFVALSLASTAAAHQNLLVGAVAVAAIHYAAHRLPGAQADETKRFHITTPTSLALLGLSLGCRLYGVPATWYAPFNLGVATVSKHTLFLFSLGRSSAGAAGEKKDLGSWIAANLTFLLECATIGAISMFMSLADLFKAVLVYLNIWAAVKLHKDLPERAQKMGSFLAGVVVCHGCYYMLQNPEWFMAAVAL